MTETETETSTETDTNTETNIVTETYTEIDTNTETVTDPQNDRYRFLLPDDVLLCQCSTTCRKKLPSSSPELNRIPVKKSCPFSYS